MDQQMKLSCVFAPTMDCPAPGLMEALIRRKVGSHGDTANRSDINGVAEHP